ncbi:hypothetical protein [Mycoplasma phocimorsus]|uniref:hypothetical protein n=1 Tax=Mycoplasma phocimorsus TaxID=3045839 RepID=UPI0024C0AC0C|nr:hypothetical protein [Mycoplasma phocimorsus]MDJ1649176.1 hypothetical protein [Mycoplasma phocimorsus]
MNKKLKIALATPGIFLGTIAISAGIIAYNEAKKIEDEKENKSKQNPTVNNENVPKAENKDNKPEVKQVNASLTLAVNSNILSDIESLLIQLEKSFSIQKSDDLEELIKKEKNDKIRDYYQKTLNYLRLNEKSKMLAKEARDSFIKFQQVSETAQQLRTNYIKIVRKIEDLDELIDDIKNGVVKKEIKYENLSTVMDNGDYIHKKDLAVDIIGSGFKAYTSYNPIDLSNVEGAKNFRKLSQFVDKSLFDENYLVEFSLPQNILEIYGPKLANLKDENKIGVLKSKTSLKVNKIFKKYINDKLDEVVVEVFTPELLVSFNNKYIPINELENIKGETKPDFYELVYSDDFITSENKELKDKKEIIASYVNERKWLDFFVKLPKKDLEELQKINELPYGFNFRIKVILD